MPSSRAHRWLINIIVKNDYVGSKSGAFTIVETGKGTSSSTFQANIAVYPYSDGLTCTPVIQNGAVNLFCQKLQTIFASYPDVEIFFTTPTPTKNSPISGAILAASRGTRANRIITETP